jgi:hypothetical protein
VVAAAAAAAAVRNDPAPDPDPEHCLQPEPEPPGESQTIVHPPAGTNWVNAGNFILTQADLDDAPGRYSKWIEDGFEEAMAAYPEGVALPPSVTKSPDGTQQFPRSYRSCYYRFSTGHIILKKRYIAPGSIKASFSDGGVDLSFQVVVFLQLDDLTIGVGPNCKGAFKCGEFITWCDSCVRSGQRHPWANITINVAAQAEVTYDHAKQQIVTKPKAQATSLLVTGDFPAKCHAVGHTFDFTPELDAAILVAHCCMEDAMDQVRLLATD